MNRFNRLHFTRVFSIALALSLTIYMGYSTYSFAYTHHKSKIEWMEYSQDAFDRAKRENKPIYMLITAVWCYWCQVFESKTLESEEVIEYLNKNYINVFVDYDRRKDLASQYPPTGLPNHIILSPQGEEIVSVPGYIPKERFLSNLKKTIEYIKTEYKPKESEVKEGPPPSKGFVYPEEDDLTELLVSMRNILRDNYDRAYGGFGFREKNSYGDTLLFLMEVYEETGERQWLDMAEKALDFIGGLKKGEEKTEEDDIEPAYLLSLYRDRSGEEWIDKVGRLQREDKLFGLYDPVEGGFFRYALLRDWSMPHFEKMLMENSEIIRAYVKGYNLLKRNEYKKLAREGIRYVLDKLYDNRGYFYGSQIADDVYYHLAPEDRKKVEPPAVDKTGYTFTNAKMVIALLEAWKVLKDDRYRDVARNVLDFYKDRMIGKRGILSYFNPEKNRGELDGQLIDNAWMALAFIEGYRVTGERLYLQSAEKILDFMITELYDTSNGGFFERRSTSREFYKKEELASYKKPYVPNGVAAYTLIRAYETTKNEGYLYKAKESIGAFLKEYPDASQPYMERAAMHLLKILRKSKGGS